MRVTRRAFVQSSAAAIALLGNKSLSAQGRGAGAGNPVPASIAALEPLANPAPPITADERRARIAKAQRLMTEHGIGAIVLESGTSMSYFVNVRWRLSERPFLLEIWNLEKKAQAAAFAAARIGATCESVDAAARKVITDAGFGPGYKVPGLPHRTGHGIGMDGHEWPNFVKGETRTLAPTRTNS